MPVDTGPSQAVRRRAREMNLVVDRLPNTIERDHYTPALLGLLNNLLVWGGSRVFQQLHGIGTNDWRGVSALGNHPGSTAAQLCEVLGINKSIVSKSVNLLFDLGMIGQLDGPRGSRHLYLTVQGAKLHDECMPIALKRQEILQESLSADEVRILDELLVRMISSSDALQAYEHQILSERGPA